MAFLSCSFRYSFLFYNLRICTFTGHGEVSNPHGHVWDSKPLLYVNAHFFLFLSIFKKILSLRFGHFSAKILLTRFSMSLVCILARLSHYFTFVLTLSLSLPILLCIRLTWTHHVTQAGISLLVAGFLDVCYHSWQVLSLDYLPEFLKVVVLLEYSCLCFFLSPKFFQPCVSLLVPSGLLDLVYWCYVQHFLLS